MPRKLAITGLYQAEFLEYEDAPLEPNQVLVKVEVASGKTGTTTAMFDNRVFAGQRFDQNMRLFVPDDSVQSLPTREAPWITGTTGIGTIAAIGAEVMRWQIGDKVFGIMDIRETHVCHENVLWALGAIDPLTALCLEPAYVSFHCVRESNVRYGETVAIIGLGALGLLAVNMARESGAETVIGIDPVASRRELALKLGADAVFNPMTEDAALAAHHYLQNAGVDVAIELSGVHAGLQTALRCARIGGTICSAGFYQGDAQGVWLGREWHHNRLTMIVPHGCGWGHVPRDYPRWDAHRARETIVSMMRKNRLRTDGIVNLELGFDESPQIFERLRDHPEGVLKFAVTL
jgi:threonine dehydrogenase-like Zn-dependent dehydrogenase